MSGLNEPETALVSSMTLIFIWSDLNRGTSDSFIQGGPDQNEKPDKGLEGARLGIRNVIAVGDGPIGNWERDGGERQRGREFGGARLPLKSHQMEMRGMQ
jgi:hypothetical protein